MNLVRNILLAILFLQFVIFLYVKLVFEKQHVYQVQSTQTIPKSLRHKLLVQKPMHKPINPIKKLPISLLYTNWDRQIPIPIKTKIKKIHKKIALLKKPKIIKPKIIKPKILKPKVVKPKVVKKEIIKPKSIKKKKIIPKISKTKKVEKYAKAKLGKKYVWGATGPRSFDCSGFTQAVYKFTTGIKIPRVSREQAKVGKYIKYKELKRGDMVFFDTEKKHTGKVNHVGIYLNNGNFIHASSARKKVIITNFKKKPFYKKRFLWGRRVLNNQI